MGHSTVAPEMSRPSGGGDFFRGKGQGVDKWIRGGGSR